MSNEGIKRRRWDIATAGGVRLGCVEVRAGGAVAAVALCTVELSWPCPRRCTWWCNASERKQGISLLVCMMLLRGVRIPYHSPKHVA